MRVLHAAVYDDLSDVRIQLAVARIVRRRSHGRCSRWSFGRCRFLWCGFCLGLFCNRRRVSRCGRPCRVRLRRSCPPDGGCPLHCLLRLRALLVDGCRFCACPSLAASGGRPSAHNTGCGGAAGATGWTGAAGATGVATGAGASGFSGNGATGAAGRAGAGAGAVGVGWDAGSSGSVTSPGTGESSSDEPVSSPEMVKGGGDPGWPSAFTSAGKPTLTNAEQRTAMPDHMSFFTVAAFLLQTRCRPRR
jgi:hypothetical protein